MLRIFVLAIFASILCACTSAPITGRSQLRLLPEGNLVKESEAGFREFAARNSFLKAEDSADARAAIATVERVSNRIIDAAGLRDQADWQIMVVKSDKPNAFVLPSGRIVVNSGLLPVARNEAGLAAVIGHEVAHVAAHHHAERMSQLLVAQTVLFVAEVALASKNRRSAPLVNLAFAMGAELGFLLPYSRIHESEADRLGQIYMARAGYPPGEAVALWQRMAADAGERGSNASFLSTHPSAGTREQDLRTWQAEAELYYADHNKALPANLAALQIDRNTREGNHALSLVAPRPEVFPGMSWQFRSAGKDENRIRVEGKTGCATGQCWLLSNSGGGSSLLSEELALVRSTNPDGSWNSFTPPLRQLRFPLKAGERWDDRVTVEYSSGAKNTVDFHFDVLDYEAIETTAGRFMCFRIVTTANGVPVREAWYAPDVAQFVRSRILSDGKAVSESDLSAALKP